MSYMPSSALPDTTAQPYMPRSAEPLVEVKAHTRKARKGKTLYQRATTLLPTVGAQVGAGLGGFEGPAATGLAALGGAGGEAARQVLSGESFTNPELAGLGGAKKILATGATEGALQAAGGQAMRAARKLGAGMMTFVLRNNPEVAQTAIREGITATAGGLARAKALREATTGAERQILEAAAQKGATIDPYQDIVQNAYKQVRSKLAGAPAKKVEQLHELASDFLKQWAKPIDPVQALKIRQFYDIAAKEAHQAVQGAGRHLTTDVERLWNQAVANETRASLQSAVPEIVDRNAYKTLTGSATLPHEIVRLTEVLHPGLKRAGPIASHVAKRLAPSAAGAGIGAALPGNRARNAVEGGLLGLGGQLALSPQLLSQVALLLSNPALLGGLASVPRAGGAAVRQAMP